ncbi:ribose-phosphate pyrophosphokinase [Acidobacteria bacterium AH-259-L09]|nr:ribose-phosphate pyrophosphokinase [Acidobacteria bacterium AH-259-L09]
MSKLKVFSGTANVPLAQEICDYLDVPLGQVKLRRFSDGEVNFQILENVRGQDVFIIQPTSPPVNENLMELLIMIDAFKRSSAQRITAVLPYYGYARQDRKDKPRVPISSKLVGDLLSAAGAHRLLTMDLHAGQIQGFFNIPVDHLFPTLIFFKYLSQLGPDNLTVVSPDAGGVEKARVYAKQFRASLAIIDKRRVGDNEAEVMHIVGEVKDRDVIIIDDLIDTAGTLMRAMEAIVREGARRLFVAATHAVLSGSAIQRIADSDFESVLVTNTIHLTEEKRIPKIKVLSVARLLGEAIKSIHEETSVSKLFVV